MPKESRWKTFALPERGFEVLKLRASGKSLKEISRILDVDDGNALRDLRNFMEDYPRIKELVETVEDQGLLKRGATDWSAEASQRIQSRMEAGFHWGPAPFGYRAVNGKLEIIQEEAAIVRHIFELRKEGRSTNEIAKTPRIGRNRFQVREILRDPRYKGMIPFHGKLIRGQHAVIVSSELWDACQPLTEGRWSGGVPPFGYKWYRGLLIVDPEKAPIVEKIFDMRLRGQTIRQIMDATGLSQTPISKMLRSPHICGKKFDAKGTVIDADWQPIIPYSRWLAAKVIRRKEEWRAKTAEINTARGQETADLIKSLLPTTRRQLVKQITARSPSCVHMWIRRLLKENQIAEQPDGLLTRVKVPNNE